MSDFQYEYYGETVECECLDKLTYKDKTVFVRTYVETLIFENDLNFVLKDILFYYLMIVYFTDINVDDIIYIYNSHMTNNEQYISDIADLDIINDFVGFTNVLDDISNTIGYDTIFELRTAVNKQVQYKTGVRLDSFEDQIINILSSVGESIKNVNIGELAEFKDILSKINNNDFDVEDIFKAYVKSDYFKNNKNSLEQSHDITKTKYTVTSSNNNKTSKKIANLFTPIA